MAKNVEKVIKKLDVKRVRVKKLVTPKEPVGRYKPPPLCTTLTNVQGTCTRCSGSFDSVHLPGDKFAYCEAHCPLCTTQTKVDKVTIVGTKKKVSQGDIAVCTRVAKAGTGRFKPRFP